MEAFDATKILGQAHQMDLVRSRPERVAENDKVNFVVRDAAGAFVPLRDRLRELNAAHEAFWRRKS
jgi:hypothetical protein